MKLLGIAVVLGLLATVWAQINVLHPMCDSPEAEEVALVAQDYLNAQHTHGYKYVLNRIEDIKVLTKPDGDNTYVLEIDLLETDCHVLDPTPLANCTVRPKHLTAVEGDCEVVLKKVAGVLTVTAFKCKTEESTEDMCGGCQALMPLNSTAGLDFVYSSLATLNNMTDNVTYSLVEVGRITTQVVSGGPMYRSEYVVVEANCTNNTCVPMDDAMAQRGICFASGHGLNHFVECKMFPSLMPIVDLNNTAPVFPPVVHVHTGSLSRKHGLRHHKLTTHHDPHFSGLLSAESLESAEVVPVIPAVINAAATGPAVNLTAAPADPAPVLDPAASSASDASASSSAEVPLIVLKRDVAAAAAAAAVVDPAISLVPVCPGKVRFF